MAGSSGVPMVLAVTIFAAILGMFQFGFNTGVTNAPQKEIELFIKEAYQTRYQETLSDSTVSTIFTLITIAFVIGGMIGGLSGGWLATKVGRKQGLLYNQVLSFTGAILSGSAKAADSYEMLIIGRLGIGIACGLFTGLVPLYITEVAPVHLRGGLGTFNQLAVTSGILLSTLLGLGDVLGSEEYWPVLVSLTAIPAVLQFILLLFLPESPSYLILERNKLAEGEKSLKKLRGTNDIEEELQEIMAEGNASENSESMSVLQLLKNEKFRLALFVTICMHLTQQLSGIGAIFYYSTKFFESAGISADKSQYATVGVGAIMVTMTIVTIPLMDRLGRRTLHFIGMIGMIACSILITISLSISNPENNDVVPDCNKNETDCNNEDSEVATDGNGIFAIISTLAFVMFFAFGPGSIPWLITGELFTQAPRSAAVAIATFVNWTGNLLVGLTFPKMQEQIQEFSFLPFTIILVFLLCVLFFYLPETKGIPVNEIEALFQVPNAWKRPIGRSDRILLQEIRTKQGKNNYGSTDDKGHEAI